MPMLFVGVTITRCGCFHRHDLALRSTPCLKDGLCLSLAERMISEMLGALCPRNSQKNDCRATAETNENADRFGSPAVDWGPGQWTYLVGPVAFRPALTGGLALSALCHGDHFFPTACPPRLLVPDPKQKSRPSLLGCAGLLVAKTADRSDSCRCYFSLVGLV
jgi:hypothetical protein